MRTYYNNSGLREIKFRYFGYSWMFSTAYGKKLGYFFTAGCGHMMFQDGNGDSAFRVWWEREREEHVPEIFVLEK